MDDSEKGRVVLAEDVRLLEQSLAAGGGSRARNGGEPSACRVQVRGQGAEQTLDALKQLCEEHPGVVPVFVHLLLPGHEVVVRARGVAVDATGELVAKLESLLGSGAAVIEHAGRA